MNTSVLNGACRSNAVEINLGTYAKISTPINLSFLRASISNYGVQFENSSSFLLVSFPFNSHYSASRDFSPSACGLLRRVHAYTWVCIRAHSRRTRNRAEEERDRVRKKEMERWQTRVYLFMQTEYGAS